MQLWTPKLDGANLHTDGCRSDESRPPALKVTENGSAQTEVRVE
jgi:hypothetical protein